MSGAKKNLRVFVLEDDFRERDFLCALLDHTDGLQCAGRCGSARQALQLLNDVRVDLVLVDLELPGLDGVGFLRAAKAQHSNLRFMVVTQHDSAEFLFPALAAGADGYVLKGSEPGFLVESIRQAHDGGAPMTPAIARRVLQTFREPAGRVEREKGLSPREIEILTQLTQGHQQKEIADNLSLSVRTVGTHLGNIYRKLHVHNAAGAVAAFLDQRRGPVPGSY
jgi:DNA-binding NarL/FixJ family response regulator